MYTSLFHILAHTLMENMEQITQPEYYNHKTPKANKLFPNSQNIRLSYVLKSEYSSTIIKTLKQNNYTPPPPHTPKTTLCTII